MKSFVTRLLLLFAMLASSFATAQENRVQVFEGTFNLFSSYKVELTLTPAKNGQFTVSGRYVADGTAGTEPPKYLGIKGTLYASGSMKLEFDAPTSSGTIPVDGRWDKEKKTLVLTTLNTTVCNIVLVPKAETQTSPNRAQMGFYKDTENGDLFTLRASSNPDQATISGKFPWLKDPIELKGTYFISQNRFASFGESRGEGAVFITMDGKFANGVFRLQYRERLTASREIITDEERFFMWVGEETTDRRNDPPKELPKGKLKGTLKIDRGAVEIGEKVKLSLNYSVSERPEAEVTESVALYGPGDVQITRSDKTRTATENPVARTFDIICAKDGTYRISTLVKGKDTDEWKDAITFTVRKGKTTTPPDEEKGTYNLVKKVIGAAPGPYADDQGWTRTAVVSEGSLKVSQVPHRAGVFQGFDFQLNWDNLPSTLKPGEVIELKCSATGTRSQKEPPGIGASAWFSGGVEIISRASADIHFPSNDSFSSSSTGHFKFKVPAPGMRDFVIEQGYTGVTFGGTFHRPCIYTYKWNGEPLAGTETDKVKPKPTTTTMVQTSPDDAPRTLTARIEPASITLRAGEPSKIVNITIGGFRTNTLDRVEVIFPQATDGWASLPGQIVVGGGAGSYDPANMGRPEHADGYFFSARSTAPSGKTRIEVIVRQKGAGEVRLALEVEVIGRERTATDPDTGGDPWSGTWEGAPLVWRPLVLKKDGDNLAGTFCNGRAKIQGSVKGNKFTFTFQDFIGVSGNGEFTLKADGSLDGWYSEDGDDKRTKYPVAIKRALTR